MASKPDALFKHGQYTIYKESLGKGGFGNVHRGFDDRNDRIIAAKKIETGSFDFSQMEVDALLKLKEHDNIVRIYDTFIHGGNRWIIMQLCRGRTLDDYMEQEDPTLPVRLELIEQLVDGLFFMHSCSVAHRDLKPKNLMVVRGHQLKICDLGLSKIVRTKDVSTLAGNDTYIAPELFTAARYDPFKSDIYSLGLLIVAIATFRKGRRLDHLFPSGNMTKTDSHICKVLPGLLLTIPRSPVAYFPPSLKVSAPSFPSKSLTLMCTCVLLSRVSPHLCLSAPSHTFSPLFLSTLRLPSAMQ